MPTKTDDIRIECPFMDRRVKLLPCQREMVLWWWQRGESLRGLGRRFKVDRRTIDFVVHPERLEENIRLREERGGSKQYYNKTTHAASMKKHRQYKKRIINL